MHTVAEVNKIREAVDADPGDRLLLLCSRSELLNVRAIGLDGLVTGHAKTFRRIPHELTRFGIFVTRIALESDCQVRFMAEGKRLLLAIHSRGQQQQSGKSTHLGVT
jgi:hypothetical protein